MASASHTVSAKIYQFPQKARVDAGVPGGSSRPVAELWGPRLERMDFGSGWYHEAAMQEEAEARKREGH